MTRIVSDITQRAEAILAKKFSASTAGVSFTQKQAFQWIKDSYDQISDYMRVPLIHGQISPIAGIRSYEVPADCFDGFNGIKQMTFANSPISKISLEEAIDRFGHGIDYTDPVTTDLSWFNPASVNGVMYWLREFDDDHFSVINTPAASDLANDRLFDLYYVQSVPEPDNLSTIVPRAFEASIGHIASYLAGRALETDKNGRGAAILEEWEARLIKRKARAARQGRRVIGEAYTQDMNSYGYIYKGRLGGYFR